MTATFKIVPTTLEHMRAAFETDLPNKTAYSLSLLENDQLLGICGFYYENNYLIVYSHAMDSLRQRLAHSITLKKWVMKGTRRVLALARKKGVPILTIANEEIEKSESYIRHFGGQLIAERIFDYGHG